MFNQLALLGCQRPASGQTEPPAAVRHVCLKRARANATDALAGKQIAATAAVDEGRVTHAQDIRFTVRSRRNQRADTRVMYA